MLITLAFPPGMQRYDASAITNGPRGQYILTPTAGQVVIDPNITNLGALLDAGFTTAPPVTTTANRPTSTYPGMMVFDSTLGYPVFRNAANTAWVNSSGSVV